MKYLLNFVLVFISVSVALSQVHPYYQSINFNLTGDLLKNQLSNLISTTHQNKLEYTNNFSLDTWDLIKLSDVVTNNNSKVLLIYGYNDNDASVENDRTRDKTLSCHTGPCYGLWNREHVYPKSMASPNLSTNFPSAGTDVHNLRSCDYSTNSNRSNKKFDNGSGNSSSNNQGNWYPGDEWKGDVARIIMYMFVRYQNQCEPGNVGVGTQLYSPNGDMPDIFLEWNILDPVSEFEELRNDEISNVQGNRNPFIDNPYLATLIWDGPIAEDKWPSINSSQDGVFDKGYPKINYSSLGLKVEKLDLTQFLSIELINVNGNSNIISKETSIETKSLSSGIYLIKVNMKNNFYLFKIFIN